MIYLASPYSHKSSTIVDTRYKLAMCCASNLIKKGLFVWSPIVHCHEMAKLYGMPTDAKFWMQYNFDFIRHSEAVFVLKIEGWDKSVGVAEEIVCANNLFIPIKYVDVLGEFV